jgi:ATP-binding cassette, subfamily C (CFTR/MRP), member 1
MWLRSAVVTSVFSKALLISAGVLGRRTVGEISNLMSVDSTRLQTLTPYLHAIWYSFLQIALSLYFLWGQVGASCLGGIAVIILVIPVTKKVSKYLGAIQKQLSKIRDRRVKLSSEVIGGMKVIKFQAWEKEFHERVEAVRNEELTMYYKYIVANCISTIIYTSVPLLVSVSTFIAYVGSGHELDVATALTSLALFEILRFPLFMLPNVLNNIVEAKVSVDRVGSFLLEQEKKPVTSDPLWLNGVQFDSATLVYESVQNKMSKPESELNTKLSSVPTTTTTETPPPGPLSTLASKLPCLKRSTAAAAPEKTHLSELEFELVVRRAQVRIAESHIHYLEQAGNLLHDGGGGGEEESKGQIAALEEELSGSKADDRRLSIRSSLRKTSANLKQSKDKDGNVITPMEQVAEEGEPEGEEGGQVQEEEDKILTLYRVSMAAQTGNLLCIVGKVGSGKSSCLNALLGDMLCVLGKVSLRGSVSYVAQRPFIQNSTLKDNILFGRPLDEEKYQHVLQVCALIPDLKVLPAGDQTEIGERGINLSGGQKARVALARAVYADTDIVLLDDPLAAVDAHVAQHLFDSCIVETLLAQNKCVILVTNALQFIKDASKIVVLQDGCVVESGTYTELYEQYDHGGDKSGGQFYDMMQTHMEGLNTADAARGKTSMAGVSNDISDPSLIPLMERLRSASTTSGGGEGVSMTDVDLLNETADETGKDKDKEEMTKDTSGKNRSRTASGMSDLSVTSTGSGKDKGGAPAKPAGQLTKDEDRQVTFCLSSKCHSMYV